jgi:hypothetical protein
MEKTAQLHNKELYDFYSSQNVSDQTKEDELGGTCSTQGEKNSYKTVVENLKGRDVSVNGTINVVLVQEGVGVKLLSTGSR